jgi:hypothetical protein
VETPVSQLVKEMVDIHNMRLRIQRLKVREDAGGRDSPRVVTFGCQTGYNMDPASVRPHTWRQWGGRTVDFFRED